MTARDRLILALDLATLDAAEEMLRRLEGTIRRFKVGLELFTAAGPRLIEHIQGRGGRVFLDLKFHDIPQTVAAAVANAVAWQVWMMDLHIAGGTAMMRAAVRAAVEKAAAIGIERPRLLGVTVLTSLAPAELRALGIGRTMEGHVLSLCSLAKEAGLDGVIASPQEAAAIRQQLGPDFLLITPGIRPRAATLDDQRRTATAREALKAGADYVVIGRPILKATDPAEAVEQLVAEMETL